MNYTKPTNDSKLYGWYSIKQKIVSKACNDCTKFYTLKESGELVEVTSVNGSKYYTESKFDDIICLGEIHSYISGLR